MLKCFTWTLLNVIALWLGFLAACLLSAEGNSVLLPVVSRRVRRTGLPRSHTASRDKSCIFHKHTHTDIVPAETWLTCQLDQEAAGLGASPFYLTVNRIQTHMQIQRTNTAPCMKAHWAQAWMYKRTDTMKWSTVLISLPTSFLPPTMCIFRLKL